MVVIALVLAATGCGAGVTRIAVPGGDPSRGAQLMDAYGCGSCHTISGIDGADAKIGPPLVDFADRRLIAGRLPNTLSNLVRWLRDPRPWSRGP